MVFYENNRCDLSSHHSHPLCVTAKDRKVELKRVMLDQRSLLNIIFLLVLDAVVVPRDDITRLTSEVSGFGGNSTYIYEFLNLELAADRLEPRIGFMLLILRRPTIFLLGRP